MVQFLCQTTCTNLFREKNCPVFYAFFKITTVLTKIFYFFSFSFISTLENLLLLLLLLNQSNSISRKKNRIVVWIFSLCCCIGTLIFSVESRNLHRNFIFFRENHATSTGKSLITKGMVDISGHHQNIAATTSFGGGKARSVGNFTNTITCNFT